jgi:hypothetical protein
MHFLRDPFTDSASVRNNRKRSKQRKLDLYWDGYLDNVPRYPYDLPHSESPHACRVDLLGINLYGAGPPLRLFVKVGTDAADAEVLSLSRRLGH